MTKRERLIKNYKPTKALAVRQKHKRDLKQKKHISNESDESKPRWVLPDLPDDVVRHILEHLGWSDQIRLRAVCKTLRSLVHGIQTIDRFPWPMNYNWKETHYGQVHSTCWLADPSTQKSYVIERAIKGEERKDFIDAVPCASRNGWVLFKNWPLFFFYSPFTNEVIKLPEVYLNYTRNMIATFSSNPNSTDCVVFGFLEGCISTWSHGDKTWTHFDLRVDHPSLGVTYASGIFYCAFQDGRLGAYNALFEEWKMFANELPVQLEGGAPAYLIESNEDKMFYYCVL